jgi:O-antigen ligase
MENKKLAVFFFITNLFLLLLTGNRISFVFLVFLLIYFGYLLQIKRITKMILSCIFIIFMLFVFKINKVFYNKFAEIFNKDTYNITYINNSTSVRNAILDCSLDVIRKTDIVYGNGIGDVHQLLSNSYKKKHPELLKYYNSHNQFFSIYLSSGLIGIFSIIILYSYLFLISYNQKNRAMMITLFYFFCMSLFENILERRNGILLFLYTLLFIFNLFQKRETDYLKSIK